MPRVPRGGRRAQRRYGQIGARPDAFWTCRFDEKQLQRLGPTAVVLDLSEAIAGAQGDQGRRPELKRSSRSTQPYADTSARATGERAPQRQAGAVPAPLAQENALDALAVQCWTSIQLNYGVCSCAAMSRLGDEGMPGACEADILGTLSMHACHAGQRQPGRPGRLEQPAPRRRRPGQRLALRGVSRVVCQDPPSSAGRRSSFSGGGARTADCQGTVEFVAKPWPLTLCRVTQDPDGGWKAVVGRGPLRGPTRPRRSAATAGAASPTCSGSIATCCAALPAPRGHHPGSRGQRALGSAGQLPRHERLSRRPGNAGPIHAATAVLGPCRQLRQTFTPGHLIIAEIQKRDRRNQSRSSDRPRRGRTAQISGRSTFRRRNGTVFCRP